MRLKEILFQRDDHPHIEVGVAATVILLAFVTTLRALFLSESLLRAGAALLATWLAVDAVTYLIHYAFDTWDFEWNAQLKLIAFDFKTHHEDYNRVVRNGALRNGTVWLSLYLVLPELLLSLCFARGGFWSVFWAGQAFLSALVPDVHRWSHMKAPAVIRALQRSRILISPREHFHHHPGIEGDHRTDWSLFNGWTNRLLNPFFASSFSWRRRSPERGR